MGAYAAGQILGLIPVAVQILLRRLQQIEEHIRLTVYFPQLVVQVLYLQKRLHLPRNSSHVLPAQNMPGVGTVLEIALMKPAHDPSGIIAHMLIANGPLIGAIIDFSLRIARDAAGICMDGHLAKTLPLFQPLHSDVFYSIGHIHAVGIDAA